MAERTSDRVEHLERRRDRVGVRETRETLGNDRDETDLSKLDR